MRVKTIILTGAMFCCIHQLQAQSISPQVIPTQGQYYANTVGLSWTLGETFTQTLSSGSNVLTLGFEQPEVILPPTIPVSQSVCGDTAYTFIFSNVTAGTGADEIEWATNSNFTSSTVASSPANISATVSVGYKDTIWIRSRIGATGETSDVITTTVTNNANPVAHAGSDITICNGSSASIGGSPIATGGTSPYIFGWNPTTALSSDTASHPSASPDSTTNYILMVIDVNACVGLDTMTVTVKSVADDKIPYATDTILCTGSSTTINIPGSQIGIRYDLKTDTTVLDSSYGTGSTISLNTGALTSTTVFRIVAIDTTTACSRQLTHEVTVVVPAVVDTPFFNPWDTVYYIGSIQCYVANANNSFQIRYSIVSGTASIDSISGCVNSVGSDFTVRAVASSILGCSTATLDWNVDTLTPKSNTQILVNQSEVDTLGAATSLYDFYTIYKDAPNGIVVGVQNSFTTGSVAVLDVTRMDTLGNIIWNYSYSNADTDRILATSAYLKGGYVYVTGFGWDSSGSKSNWNTFKISIDSGNISWISVHTSSYNGYNAPVSVLADNSGNVYVAGTDQTSALTSRFTVVKYDASGSVVWTGTYDSSGFFNAAIGMQLSGSDVVVTGFSGSGFSSWDFVTVSFSAGSGATESVTRSANSDGSFSQPVGIIKDGANSLYIAGTSAISDTTTDIKIIKYDSLFNQLWVAHLGDSSMSAHASAITNDALAHPIVTGYVIQPNGAKNMIIARYEQSGTLDWSHTIGTNSSYDAEGVAVTTDAVGNVYLAGKTFNGTNFDLTTIAYNATGNTIWSQTYTRASNTDENPLSIAVVGSEVWVTGTSLGTDSVYFLVKYQPKSFSSTLQFDSNALPIYVKNQLIIQFDTSMVNQDVINNENIIYGTVNTFLKQAIIDTLNAEVPYMNFSNAYIEKLALHQHTYDTIAISNIGDTVYLLPFWASFLVMYSPYSVIPSSMVSSRDSSGDVPATTEIEIRNVINTLSPEIKYAQLNHVYQYANRCTSHTSVYGDPACGSPNPTDPNYNCQYGLYEDADNIYVNGNVDVEPAWVLETGKPFVKVGIFDSGIDAGHEDFLQSAGVSKVIGGYDYLEPVAPTQIIDDYGHGTKIAGIAGALRNNGIGIAGIAGGDFCSPDQNPGVSLYDFKVASNETPITDGAVLSAMYDGFDIMPNIADGTFNVDIGNFSFRSYMENDGYTSMKLAFYFASRLGKICVVAGAENTGDFEKEATYPADFDDDWILCVGGSDANGDLASVAGSPMDVMAPYTSNLNYTTWSSDDPAGGPGTLYGNPPDGTSFSAAYGTGAAGLLLSYMNNPNGNPDPANLAPEDVQQILDRTAYLDPNLYMTLDPNIPNYSDFAGYGRMDIGKALNMVNKNTSRLLHFNSNDYNTTYTLTQVGDSPISIDLIDDVPNSTILHGYYNAEVWEMTESVPHDIILNPGESIQGFWARSSASNSYALYNVGQDPNTGVPNSNLLEPFEKSYVDEQNMDATASSATIWGYYYKLVDDSGDLISWIPKDPTISYHTECCLVDQAAKLSYTIYVSTATVTDVKKILPDFNLKAYPNPANNSLHVDLSSSDADFYSITIYDVMGRKVKNLFNGNTSNLSENYDVDDLMSGMYYLQVTSSNSQKDIKLSIVH